jgi:hypothetical protein
MIAVLKVIAWVAGIILLFLAGLFLWGYILFTRPIHKIEAHLVDPATWEPACSALAKMCQSDRKLFGPTTNLDTIIGDRQRVPPEIVSLQPEFLSWRPYGIDVWFGGGFHHFQYELSLDQSASTETIDQWTLTFADEGHPAKVLKKFSLPKSAQYTSDDLTGWRPISGAQWEP